MKLIKENVEINVNDEIGEITSIKINNNEILYQGNETWKKTFPILFPVVGIVKKWTINGKDLQLKKHGYWKELKWNAFYDENDLVLTTICNSKILPYIFDIHFRIAIMPSQITLTVSITNASTKNAYFQFGWHPAFKINHNSILKFNKNEKANVINLNGQIENNNQMDINNKIINNIKFGDEIDSLIIQNNTITNAKIFNESYNLNLYFDAPNLVLWKKDSDNFICVEPYYGYSDQFSKDFKTDIKHKKDIIELSSLETFNSIYVIKYEEKTKEV